MYLDPFIRGRAPLPPPTGKGRKNPFRVLAAFLRVSAGGDEAEKTSFKFSLRCNRAMLF